MFEWAGKRNRFGSKGRRVCMARYGAALAAARKLRPFWSLQFWERTHYVIEEGMLKGNKVEKLLLKGADVDAAAEGSTGVSGLSVDDGSQIHG